MITLEKESRHPLSEPAQWVAAYSNHRCRMRGLLDRAAAFPCEAEGCEGEGRGRPIRKVRLMVLAHRPRPEDSRREASFSQESLRAHPNFD